MLSYELAEENTHEAPIKTQVERRLVVPLSHTPEQLCRILNEQFDEVMDLRGFEHHTKPTNVYIYAHDTEEKAMAGGSTWIAMLAFSQGDSAPELTIDEDRLASLREPPSERFGFDEEMRKIVYWELVAIEREAAEIAMREYPNPADWEKQIALEEKLIAEGRAEVIGKHCLSSEAETGIAVEGIRKGWPTPPIEGDRR